MNKSIMWCSTFAMSLAISINGASSSSSAHVNTQDFKPVYQFDIIVENSIYKGAIDIIVPSVEVFSPFAGYEVSTHNIKAGYGATLTFKCSLLLLTIARTMQYAFIKIPDEVVKAAKTGQRAYMALRPMGDYAVHTTYEYGNEPIVQELKLLPFEAKDIDTLKDRLFAKCGLKRPRALKRRLSVGW